MHERAGLAAGMTLVHGDLNPSNILMPRVAGLRTLFLDRQPFAWSLRRWLGASDVSYAVVPWWEPSRRRELEAILLRHYHGALRDRGHEDYPFVLLWRDYKLAAAQCLYIAVEWCIDPEPMERMRWLWMRTLRRTLAAIQDLDCAAL
jgi:hypothetical protein